MTGFSKLTVLRGLFLLIFVGVIGVSARGQVAELAISPARLPEGAGGYTLLPPEDDLVDADAVPLYEKAMKALPGGSRTDQIGEWLNLSIEQLPVQQAEGMLEKHAESLTLVKKAARCAACNWPQWKPEMPAPETEPYREMAFAIALQARLNMAQEQYDRALVSLQTGFGMAQQLGQSTTLLQTLVGTAVGQLMGREVEHFVQGSGTPNLYGALAEMPAPLVDVEAAIQYENRAGLAEVTNEAWRQEVESQLKAAHARVRLNSRRLDAHLAALQCVEALRGYAAAQTGRLPNRLADIEDVSLPDDPLTGKPFQYRHMGSKAVLYSATASSGNEIQQIRYEITVKD